MKWNKSNFAVLNSISIMRIENIINKVKEILLWIYIGAVLSGIVYAVSIGQEIKAPGEIIYEKTHTQWL